MEQTASVLHVILSYLINYVSQILNAPLLYPHNFDLSLVHMCACGHAYSQLELLYIFVAMSDIREKHQVEMKRERERLLNQIREMSRLQRESVSQYTIIARPTMSVHLL